MKPVHPPPSVYNPFYQFVSAQDLATLFCSDRDLAVIVQNRLLSQLNPSSFPMKKNTPKYSMLCHVIERQIFYSPCAVWAPDI